MAEFLLVVGAGGILAYNAFYKSEPEVAPDHPAGTQLPTPRFLYSDPAIWTFSPVDVSYRPYTEYWGPNNDPRRAYTLFGGTRIPHSGYNPVATTNQVWTRGAGAAPPASVPSYSPAPHLGRGVEQRVTSKTVFKE